jgi:putative ABC transport system permease protein
MIAIEPGREPTGPMDVAQMYTDSLKAKDIDALLKKENVPGLEVISPMVFGGVTGSYENETYRFTVIGSSDQFTKIMDVTPESGRFLSEDDVKMSAAVAVVGSKVKEKLFGADDPIVRKIKIKGVNLRIIGFLPSKGSSLMNFDEMVFVPYTTAQNYILGLKHYNEIHVLANPNIPIEQTVRDIKATLRISHNITDPTKDDFYISTQADILERVGTVTLALTLLLSSVAGISLLVGGIGIMNIMLVSVTERTREIGLRKALGATEGEIQSQFLTEAIILTFVGGVVGVLFGALISAAFAFGINYKFALGWVFSLPLNGALLGIGVSTFIGLVFGYVPARRAAKKNPIEALRYE